MDFEYLLALQNLRNSMPAAVGDIASILSEISLRFSFWLPFLIYWIVDKESGIFVLVNYSAARVVNGIIKVTACIYRPWILDSRIQPQPEAQAAATGYSFPSGHTTRAAATYGSAAMKAHHTWLKWALWIWVLFTGFSRNFLGVHTGKDVLVGLISGTLVVIVAGPIWNKVRQNKTPAGALTILAIVVCVIVIAYTMMKGYPVSELVDYRKMQKDTIQDCAVLIGSAIGLYLESKFVQFHTRHMRIGKVCIRIVFGVGIMDGLIHLLELLDNVIDFRLATFLAYSIACFIGTFIIPYLFTKAEHFEKIITENEDEK